MQRARPRSARYDDGVSRAVEKLYLGYLLGAPLGATVMATVTYDGPKDFVLGILSLGGAVAVAIYAAFIATYLVGPKVWWRALLAIVDGPLLVALAAVALDGWRILDLTTWFFVAEAVGIYLGIAAVAVRANEMPAVGIMLACVGLVCFGSGWALFPKLAGDWRGAVMFAASIAQSGVSAYWIADRDRSVRDADTSSVVILVSLGLFFVAIGLGALLRFVILT
jgi:hypothetical protein